MDLKVGGIENKRCSQTAKRPKQFVNSCGMIWNRTEINAHYLKTSTLNTECLMRQDDDDDDGDMCVCNVHV